FVLGRGTGGARFRLVGAEWRDAPRLPGLQPVLAVDAAAVHPQLAFADDALDVREAQAGKARLEEAVDPHAGFVGRHRDGLHRAGGREIGLRRLIAALTLRAPGRG